MRVDFYSNATERQNYINAAVADGEIMVHDDFVDASGNATDGTSGKLSFETYEKPTLSGDAAVRAARKIELEAKLDDDSMTFAELKELLRNFKLRNRER